MRLQQTPMRLRRTAPRSPKLLPALALWAGIAAAPAFADEACTGFKWDVSKELALFASTAVAQPAGKDGASATVVVPNRLYELQLKPQSEVAFSVPPGKKMSDAGTYAGIAALKIPSSGSYRISLDLGLWVDVSANGKLVPARDYEGQHSCDAPHKIVVFDLDSHQTLLLQFSAGTKPTVRLTVTQVPLG
jgi:hypothetical protein